MKGSSSHYVNENDSVEKRSQVSKKSGKMSSKDNSRFTTLNKTTENFKFEIPDSCKVTMMKKVLIEKLNGKYFLASHPYPKIQGEMIIFKPKKSDQGKDKDIITYTDFSLRKRIETTAGPLNAQKKKNLTAKKDGKDKEKEDVPPKLQCLEVDTTAPLNHEEWSNFIQVI